MRTKFVIIFVLMTFTAPAWSTMRIHHWTLKNGARVYFTENHQLPIVDVHVFFDAGAARDPAGRNGLANLTASLLDEGIENKDATAIAETFERNGAEFSAHAGQDYTDISLRSLSESRLLQPSLKLFSELLLQPTFPEKNVQRIKRTTLIGLQAEKQSAGKQAQKLFMKKLFGTHPYANRVNGEENDIKAIDKGDLIQFHKEFYVGQNATLAIAGNLTLAQAKQVALTIAGSLPAGKAAASIEPITDLSKAAIEYETFPSQQTHIIMGQPGVYRGDPDYFPLYVGNYILGGSGLTSRLAHEAREKRGLTYNVQSYFVPMRQRGPYQLILQTRNDRREEALSVLKNTLKAFVESGPSVEELEAAKKFIIGSFPLRLDSNRDIVNYLSVIGFYRLPLTYLDDFQSKIDAVTVTAIKDAFKRRIHPDKMITIMLGGK